MTGHYVGNAIVFLVQAAFGLYLLAVMLRLLLGWIRADFHNPLSQFVVRLTNPLLLPLRRIIPGFGGIDVAAVILLFLLQSGELFLIGLVIGSGYRASGILIWTIAELLALLLNIFLFSIIAEAVLSWISQGHNPISPLLRRLNYPLLAPLRRHIPTLSGLDFSPFVAILLIQLSAMLFVAPIRDLGQALAGGF